MKNRKIWIGVVLTLLCTLLMGVSVFAADATMKNKIRDNYSKAFEQALDEKAADMEEDEDTEE